MSTTIKRLAAAGATASLLAGGAVVVTVAPANAVGGNCSATRQMREVVGPNEYRSRASCSSLQGDTRARAQLNRDGGPDYFSSWFTRLNTYYYTGYYSCYSGCSATYQIDHV